MKPVKALFTILPFIGLTLFVADKASCIEWANFYEPAGVGWAHFGTRDTFDGGYLIVAESAPANTGLAFYHGSLWVLKLTATGLVQWSNTYGTAAKDVGTAAAQGCDKGFLIAGRTLSFGSTKGDAWALKLGWYGDLEWQFAYGDGGVRSYIPKEVKVTPDCGYVIVGQATITTTGQTDAWAMKLDQNGNLVWNFLYGGTKDDWFNSVELTADGGLLVAGRTCSFGMADAWTGDGWILKLTKDGIPQWQKTYGGASDDEIKAVSSAPEGYVAVGRTWSLGKGRGQGWVMGLDPNGNVIWQREFGGEEDDDFTSVARVTDGFLVAGRTCSFSFDSCSAWLQKLDFSGNSVWERAYYTNVPAAWEAAVSVANPGDGGVILSGTSLQADLTPSVWVLRTDEVGDIEGCPIVIPAKTPSASISIPGGTSSPGYIIPVPTLPPAPSAATPAIATLTKKEACPFPERGFVSVSLTGSGTGSVVSDPPGISCGSDCSEVFPAGTEITLTASPSPDSSFTGWSGGPCQDVTKPTCTFEVPAGLTTISANFERAYTLQVQVSGSGFGTVVSDPSGIACGTDCRENYTKGQVVRLTPRPFPGSVFSGWGGDADCSDGIVVMSSNRTCIANFERTISTSGLRVIAPNGGETLISGETYQIQWSAPSTSSPFTVQYSLDGGATWQTIAKKVSGSSISWTVPPVDRQMDQCLIKVKKRGTVTKSSSFDISDAPFTIKPGF